MHLALEEHVQMACTPLQRRGRWRQTGRKTDAGGMNPGNNFLHIAQDSLNKLNFNSVAVATNRNPLKNRDVHEPVRGC